MSKKDEVINNVIAVSSGILTLILPFAQFAIDFLNEVKGIFLDQSIIFFTTTTTFFLSVFVIFAVIQNKYYRHVNKRKSERYQKYREKKELCAGIPEKLSELEVVTYPHETTLKELSLYAIILFFFTAMIFLWMGLMKGSYESSSLAVFIQAVNYVLTYTIATFIVTVFAVDSHDKKNWQKNRQERIQRAINLAKENNAFKEFPKISFFSAIESQTFPQQLIIRVHLGESKRYIICTDIQAEILYSVSEEPNPSEIPQDK